jgi:hypothetical protein
LSLARPERLLQATAEVPLAVLDRQILWPICDARETTAQWPAVIAALRHDESIIQMRALTLQNGCVRLKSAPRAMAKENALSP